MKILCFGAGAIGGYVGLSLALQGHELAFLERPHNLDALQKAGLRLQLDEETKHIERPALFASIEAALDAGPYDFAILALKSYDTEAALDSLRGLEARMPPVLCLQNGVYNEAAIAERLGEEKVIAGTVTTAIGKPSLGQFKLERKRGIGIGAGHPLAEAITHAMNSAGLNARLYADGRAMKWSKLLTNLLANAQCAILDQSPSQVLGDFASYRVEAEAQREALRVMRALNLPVVDLPGTPVRALAFGMGKLPMHISQPLVSRVAGKGRGDKMPSLHIDRFGGRQRSEVAWLNGAVARWGAELGLETPVNTRLNQDLQDLVHAR